MLVCFTRGMRYPKFKLIVNLFCRDGDICSHVVSYSNINSYKNAISWCYFTHCNFNANL